MTSHSFQTTTLGGYGCPGDAKCIADISRTGDIISEDWFVVNGLFLPFCHINRRTDEITIESSCLGSRSPLRLTESVRKSKRF